MALHTTSSLAEALGVEKTALDGLAAVNHNAYMVPFEFMGETDFRSLIEGDRKYGREDNLGEHGYTEQEFQDEQLVDVEEEPDEEDFEIEFEETDDFAYNDSDNE